MNIDNSTRLSYALMTKDDADLLFQLDQDPEVMRYINGGNANTKEYIETIYIPRLRSFTDCKKGWGLWKVIITDTQQFIGWVLVRPMNFFGDSPEFNNLELGWRFMREFWGKGYATEAAQTVKNTFINQGTIQQLTAISMVDNTASINIMKKLNMIFEKKEFHKDPLGDAEVVYYTLPL